MISLPNFSGIIGLWLMFQVVTSVVSSLVMIYVLFCLGKTASSLERMAAAIEKLAEHQTTAALPQGRGPGGMPPASFNAPYIPTTPPYVPAPEVPPIPFTPGAPPPSPAAVAPKTPPPSESEFASGPNVPYVPRREMRP